MDPELYIPPCCIHLQLPALVASGRPFVTFYSQGDWGFPKLSNAIESMVDSHRGDVSSVLIMSDLTQDTVRYVVRELKMEWSKAMVIVTFTDRTELLRAQLPAAALDRICYCPNRREVAGCNLWMRHNGQSSMFVMGPIAPTDAGPRAFSAYTAYYHSADDDDAGQPSAPLPQAMRQAFAPWRSMCRLRATIRGSHPLLDLWLK